MASQAVYAAACPPIKGRDHIEQPVLRPLLQANETDKSEQVEGRTPLVGSQSTCCAEQLRESGLFGLEQRQVWRHPIQPVCLAKRPRLFNGAQLSSVRQWVTASISTTGKRRDFSTMSSVSKLKRF